MRVIPFCFLLLSLSCFTVRAQDTVASAKGKSILKPVDPSTVQPFLSDSAVKANRQSFIGDSIAMRYLIPDSSNRNAFLDSIKKTSLDSIFLSPASRAIKRVTALVGSVRNTRDVWVIFVSIGLLLYAGLLNLFLDNDLKSIFQAFYARQPLSQTDKESGLVSSRAFIGLFILFCLTLGLFLYLFSEYSHFVYRLKDAQLFIAFSVGAGLLVALKFFLLKFLGFVFDIKNVTSEYIAILNLSYFNMAFVFLCATICFSLLQTQLLPLLFVFTLGLTGIVFVWQYLRNSLKIISDFRFHKFYLFVYLCALEICPVLILIKAIDR